MAYEIIYTRRKLPGTTEKKIVTQKDAVAYLTAHCFPEDEMWREKCYALYLDQQGTTIGHLMVSIGSVSQTVIDANLVAKGAINTMAHGVILCHNHPGKSPAPSRNDIDQTSSLKKVLTVLNIQLIDHIILAESDYYSFADDSTGRYARTKKAS